MAETPDTILRLADNFEQNIDSYKSAGYNETQLRREFIDPFFEVLGWDIQNKAGIAAAYKDVIHEDAIKIGGSTKAPDYCFRIGPAKKFFVEAKKPAVDIKNNSEPAYQLRRYAWSAKLPLSILTNFEEFAVYDCQIRPNVNDKPSTGRILLINYKEYGEKWEQIANVFSKEAVYKGLFDKFASEKTIKKGTTTVDKEFLNEIENWRGELAKNIAIRNERLSVYDLNFAVQKTIDRILFLRICEDRGIERSDQLLGYINGTKIYPRLFELFEKSDERYNSGIFHFRKEKDRQEEPDEIASKLKVDDDVLKKIIRDMYYPCPYEFSVMPAEILGNVYEQFLGKVIRLTAAHQAKVEEKPEVKKAGGVYYTPSYIVDYIVKNTVGKLCEGKTPKQIEKIKILDPACGSGSFLIGAYKYLLDYHRDYYFKEVSKNRKYIYQGKGGQWFLAIEEKKRILLNNIFGVDIDSQAVEVTKLSLLLKVLENETQESLRLFHERALPDLGNNIKCGNSLIGSDFYQNHQLNLFDDEQQRKINAFDWEKEFLEILSGKNPGFDCVIGNPPYGFRQIHSDYVKPYFKSHYFSANGSFESYFLFYEASLKKLKRDGYHGFIAPVTWLTIPSAASLRKFILDNFSLNSIVWLPELVFKNAQVNTLVSIIRRTKPDITKISISNVNDPAQEDGIHKEIKQSKFALTDYVIHIFESTKETDILRKIESQCVSLGLLAHPCSGYNPYEVGKGEASNKKPHTLETVESRPYHSATKKGEDWKPEIIGRDLRRYALEWPKNRFVKYGLWLAAPRDPNNFVGPRLLVQEITGGENRRIIAAYCEKELYHSRDVIPIKCNSKWPKPFFLLGIINSWLITWRHHRRSPKAKKALFPKVLVSDLRQIPIPKLSEIDMADKGKHDKMVSLVEQMLELNKKISKIKNPNEKERIQRQIDSTDDQIDKLVYELYDLTKEEIGIVEKA